MCFFFSQIRVSSVRYLEQGVSANAAASGHWEEPQLDSGNVVSTSFSLYHYKDREFLYTLHHDCDHSYTSSLEILI